MQPEILRLDNNLQQGEEKETEGKETLRRRDMFFPSA